MATNMKAVQQVFIPPEEIPDEWEALCDAARQAAEHMDEGRWVIGEYSHRVEKRYGTDAIGEFAKQVGISKGRVKQYRTVFRFWSPVWEEKDGRLAFLAERPNVTYTHYLDAMRLKDVDKALEWVDKVAENGWTTDEAAYYLSKRLGKGDPPEKLLECNITVCGYYMDTERRRPILDQVVIMLNPEAAKLLTETEGEPLQIVVRKAVEA
jgi:hypothetical protein